MKNRQPGDKEYAKVLSKKGLRSTLIGIIASAILAVVKGLGGIFGNSYALIADAIESAADVFSSAMLWFGLKWASRPADENHPYGHGKVEALIAVGISLGLVGAAVIIVRDSIRHILEPHKTPEFYTLIILVLVILVKELLFRYVLRTGEKINSNVIKADAFHHRSDAITSVAAFIGISVGLIGGEGYEVADDYAALFAAVVIVINAYGIFRPAIGELLDEAMEPELRDEIYAIARSVPEVIKVHKYRSRKMGIMVQVDLHIWVDRNKSVKEGHDIAHNVKEIIITRIPRIADVHIHIEPD